jgi:predicted enzyme related to lactoylglutathione lyase
MQAKFVEIQRFVSDLPEARLFYENVLALGVKRHCERYVVYDLGSCDLVISGGAARQSDRPYGRQADTVISFVSANLDQHLVMLRSKGIPIVHEVHDSPEGRLAVIQDPDGNFVELIQ